MRGSRVFPPRDLGVTCEVLSHDDGSEVFVGEKGTGRQDFGADPLGESLLFFVVDDALRQAVGCATVRSPCRIRLPFVIPTLDRCARDAESVSDPAGSAPSPMIEPAINVSDNAPAFWTCIINVGTAERPLVGRLGGRTGFFRG